MIATRIKYVVFDLGAVLIKIHPEKFIKINHLDQPQITEKLQKYIIDTTMGYKDTLEALEEIAKEFNLTKTPQKLLASYKNDFLGDKIEGMHVLIRQMIEHSYKVCLLSNINTQHYEWCKPHYNDFSDFYKVYLSYELHLMKPEKKIYEHMISDLQAQPEEILFIDDLKKNIDGAAALGINIIQTTPNEPEIDKIKAYLGIDD